MHSHSQSFIISYTILSVVSLFSEQNSMWMLEREEMEQLLDSTKTALFAEQRPARKKLESLHEVILYLIFFFIRNTH